MELTYSEQKALQDILESYIREKRKKDRNLDMDGKYYNVAHKVIKEDINNAENLLEKLWDYMSNN